MIDRFLYEVGTLMLDIHPASQLEFDEAGNVSATSKDEFDALKPQWISAVRQYIEQHYLSPKRAHDNLTMGLEGVAVGLGQDFSLLMPLPKKPFDDDFIDEIMQ